MAVLVIGVFGIVHRTRETGQFAPDWLKFTLAQPLIQYSSDVIWFEIEQKSQNKKKNLHSLIFDNIILKIVCLKILKRQF